MVGAERGREREREKDGPLPSHTHKYGAKCVDEEELRGGREGG